MYLLYTEKLLKEQKEPVKFYLYRSIFNNEYKFCFHVPKKDFCSIINRFNNLCPAKRSSGEETKAQEAHMQCKHDACKQKNIDRKRANKEKTLQVCFDLKP